MNFATISRPGILGPWVTLFKHYTLIREMTKREVIGRYRGSIFGVLWSFFNPMLLLSVYTFIFGYVFKSRWGLQNEGQAEYAVILFVGMIIHSLFAECANRAPQLIVGNPNYVKKVIFPLETLAWVNVGTALFHALVSSSVLLVALIIVRGPLPWTALAFPLVLLAFLPAIVGTVWVLSSLGVFVRDLHQAVAILTMMLMFLAPVFYAAKTLTEPYRSWLFLNPLTFVIEQSRNVLIWGLPPDWSGLGLYAMGAILFAWLGYWWFQRTRPGFADVL